MRLTCPNCGAQYEVPQEVIPEAGRDVQCSNCGDTWFQTRDGAGDDAQTFTPEEAGWVEDAPVHPSEPEPEAEPEGTRRNAAPDVDHESEPDAEPHSQEAATAQRRGLDPNVASVLREEANREQQAREAEGESLETQPDLGLSGNAPEDRRAKQARDRMARLRGETAPQTDPEPRPTAEPPLTDDDIDDDLLDPGTRRNLLPDIEEINSTIAAKPDEATADTSARDGTRTQPLAERKKGGFVRGLAIAVILVAAGIGPYLYAPKIKETVPALAASLDAYVATINKGRVALESQLGDLPDTLRAMFVQS